MKLDKAIEILTTYLKADEAVFHDDLIDAIKLGIEALKRYRSLQLDPSYKILTPLPGETEDCHSHKLPLKGITIEVE